MSCISYHGGRYKFTKKPFTTLALRNLVFEDKGFRFTKSTPEQKVRKQSSPWAPPPPIADNLKAMNMPRLEMILARDTLKAGDEPLSPAISPLPGTNHLARMGYRAPAQGSISLQSRG